LSPALQEELREALASPVTVDDRWSDRMVAEWMTARLGRPVSRYRGWNYLQRLKPKPRHGVPQPRHALADPEEQEAFKRAETAGAHGCQRISAGHRRALGHGRASHWAQAAAAPGLDAG
jgi:hypothetical protein